KDSKKQHLTYMIYEKLLSLDGYRKGIEKTEDARLSLAEVEGDLATEEMYKRDILSKVKVSEGAIQYGITQNRKLCSVKWIYQRTKEQIQYQVNLLNRGISFDSLFNEQMNDTITMNNRSMEMTRLQIGMKNPVLGKIL